MADPTLKINVATDAAAAAAGLNDVAGAVDRVGAAGNQASGPIDAAAGAVSRYGSASADAASKVAGAADAADRFGGGIGDLGDSLQKIGPAVAAAGFPGLAGAIDTATIATDAAEGAMGLFTAATSVLSAVQGSAKLSLVASTAAMYAQAAASAVVKAATVVWTGVQWALNAALTANPIGIIIVLIALLVAAIVIAWKKSETFRKIVTAAWNGIKAAVAAVVNWIKATIPPIWQKAAAVFRAYLTVVKIGTAAIKAILTTTWNAIKTVVTSVWNAIRSKVTGVFSAIKAAARTVGSVVSNAFRSIRGAISPVLNAIHSVIGAIKDLIHWISSVHVPNWLSKLTSTQRAGIPASAPQLAPVATRTALAATTRPAGRTVAGGTSIVINVPATANPAETGRQLVKMIRAYERTAGTRWRAAAAGT